MSEFEKLMIEVMYGLVTWGILGDATNGNNKGNTSVFGYLDYLPTDKSTGFTELDLAPMTITNQALARKRQVISAITNQECGTAKLYICTRVMKLFYVNNSYARQECNNLNHTTLCSKSQFISNISP